MSADWDENRPLLLAAAGVGVGLAARQLVRRLREIDLKDRVVVVTGGSRGLGYLLAREFGREGCRVAICARDDAELRRASDDLTHYAPAVFAGRCDIADRKQVERFIRDVTQRLGPVDVLVNNAGIIQVGPLNTMTVQDFEVAMGIMFWGVVYPTLTVLPQMRARGSGSIVNITSIGGKISAPHLLPYSSAKFAAVGFSEGLRAEVAGEGISVTTVVPGFMRTGSHLNAFFTGRSEREFAWFSLGAALPFVSMDAERAARQIVRAAKRREAETILSTPATLAVRFHGLFPGVTARLLELMNRLVLPTGEGSDALRGAEAEAQLRSRTLDILTSLGRRAAERFHEHSGPEDLPDMGRRSGRTP